MNPNSHEEIFTKRNEAGLHCSVCNYHYRKNGQRNLYESSAQYIICEICKYEKESQTPHKKSGCTKDGSECVDFLQTDGQILNQSGTKKPDDSFCPHSDPLHDHHDGCPSCYNDNPEKESLKVYKSLHPEYEEKPKLESFSAEYSCDDCEKVWIETHSDGYTKESVEKSLNYIKDECSAIFEKMPLSTKQEEYWGEKMIKLIEYVEERLK